MKNVMKIFYIFIFSTVTFYGDKINNQIDVDILDKEITNFCQALDVVDVLAKKENISANDYIVTYIGFMDCCLIKNDNLFFEKYYKSKDFIIPRKKDVLKKENHFFIVRFDSFSKNKSSCVLKINIVNPKTSTFFYLNSNIASYYNLLKSVIERKHLTKPLRNILEKISNIINDLDLIKKYKNCYIIKETNINKLNSIGLMYNNSFYRDNRSFNSTKLPFWYTNFYEGFNFTNYWKDYLCLGGVIKIIMNLSGDKILNMWGGK